MAAQCVAAVAWYLLSSCRNAKLVRPTLAVG